MLMPKKTKYRKMQKGTMGGRSKGARTIAFGEYGLVAVEPSWVTARQIEAARVTVSKRIKKVGTLYLRMFPDKPVSKKPAETRMGKGKGSPELWVAVVKRDRVILEIGGVSKEEARDILKAAAYKFPMKTRFVSKEDLLAADSQTNS
ncbi:MAG: 50S ribosomal protein L16 [candidate division TM6 bacterium GW2011_GWF2_38_10]|nr:MAG: 50S ribosomal protein L16 [candidate division TM6 bacterium GW2011_GWF2_38_10]